jgi:group I intron endonuclease
MEIKLFIYSLTDPITNEIRYIGKSYNPIKRLKEHIYHSSFGKTHRDYWLRNLLKNNQKPILNILEECNSENWIIREQYYISLFSNLTNLTNGGNGTHGLVQSQETIQKRILANTGKKRSDEYKLSVSLRRLGSKHTEKTKELLALIRKGKQIHNERYKENLRIKVNQLDLQNNLIKEWDSISEILKHYPHAKISECINNKRKTSLGYKWVKKI